MPAPSGKIDPRIGSQPVDDTTESPVEAGLRGRGRLWFLGDTDALLARFVLAEVLARPRAHARRGVDYGPPGLVKKSSKGK